MNPYKIDTGGPFGIEPSVKAAGNFYAILGLSLMPILWAVPEAYMTYKLSMKHPCASGGALWVELAFGERMGLIVGYLGECFYV
jgi:amino acid transporter